MIQKEKTIVMINRNKKIKKKKYLMVENFKNINFCIYIIFFDKGSDRLTSPSGSHWKHLWSAPQRTAGFSIWPPKSLSLYLSFIHQHLVIFY